jgi:hypothetical protein
MDRSVHGVTSIGVRDSVSLFSLWSKDIIEQHQHEHMGILMSSQKKARVELAEHNASRVVHDGGLVVPDQF